MSNNAIVVYSTFVALLSLVALVGAAGLIVFRIVKRPEAALVFGGRAIWLAWIVALVATVGSLIYSEVIHFVPCRLCWFQRIAMYPMAIILLVGAIRREFQVRYYALPLALVGLGISIYHVVVQNVPGLESGACDPSNPCSAKYVDIFNFISIPFMAGAGFILLSVLLGFYVNKNSVQETAEDE
ncbi:MAG TPA: disulfide oxidoreductase [Acidimicrobiia bacterium]|jgi:disulfide bond formation protein DsbB|nr:disulfide oxidoreductase [Acidimicrobiia bacterium]